MTKLINWLGHKYVEPDKVPETEPWSRVSGQKVPAQSPADKEFRELHHPASVPAGIEKNSDSIWAEFESVVPDRSTPLPASETQDDDWVDTLSHNEFADTVRDEFDDS